MTSPEIRVQIRRWFVETGHADGNGVGAWEGTEESHEVSSKQEAEALRDAWEASGKLVRTHWGELRPDSPYGLFRIRSTWADISPEELIAHPEAQARIALEQGRRAAEIGALLRQAGSAAYRVCAETRHVTLGNKVEAAILAISPDAQAALDKVVQEAIAHGMEQAVNMMKRPGDCWRMCTTTGGPNHEGERWVHIADFNELSRRVDSIRAAAATIRSLKGEKK